MHHRLIAVAVATLGLQANAAAQSTTNGSARTTQAQLQAMGTAYVRHLVDSVGESKDPRTRADIAGLLDKLRVAAGIPTRDFHWVLINDSTVNAAAVPGGNLVINIGLVTMARSFAKADFPNDSAKRQRRFLGFLGSVLGHEIAHHTLGHTEDPQGFLKRAPGAAAGGDNSLEARIEQAIANPALLKQQAFTRDRELAADRTGSLYLLRAGYEIQDAMDMFRALDTAVERPQLTARHAGDVSLIDSVGTVSWLRDHPRASEREGALEAFRGSLKQDQTRFDDALILVRTGLQLDTAVMLLDKVLEHFPDLREAQHLRAAAFHQKFIRQMPVEELAVRSTVATYPARFYTKIRDAGARDATLNEARQAYRDLMAHVVLPFTLANLAVLDAYAGQLPLAIARADSAVRLDAKSPDIRVNQGVVYYLAKRYRDALASFQTAARLAGEATPVINFDLGRTMIALGDTAKGRALLREYADNEDASQWQAYAATLAGSRPAAKSGAATPMPKISAPVALRQSAADVRAAIGAPEGVEPIEGGSIWKYDSRGFRLGVMRDSGVTIIALGTPKAGSIDGLSVGSTMARARAAWGQPTDTDGNSVYFRRGGLVIIADDDGDGTIEMLTIGIPR